jgi:polyhydroxyalkanoate synthesis regulator phasin
LRYILCLEGKMTEQTEKSEPKTVRGSLYETTRLILLASVGVLSLAQEEVNNFLDRLVERGEMAEADARKLAREVVEKREKLEKERREHRSASRRADQPAVATRADIDALTARIAELTRQIEELRKEKTGETTGGEG